MQQPALPHGARGCPGQTTACPSRSWVYITGWLFVRPTKDEADAGAEHLMVTASKPLIKLLEDTLMLGGVAEYDEVSAPQHFAGTGSAQQTP